MPDEIVTIGFRGTGDYRKRLQQEALNRGIKVQRLLEEAVTRYVGSHGTPQSTDSKENPAGPPFDSLTPEERRWLAALLAYLRDRTKPARGDMLKIMAAALGLQPEDPA